MTLREVLTVQNPTTVALGGGASETAWSDEGALRGRVRVLRGREYLQARQVGSVGTYEVTVRYPYPDGTTLTSRSRLVWQSAAGPVTLSCTEPPRIDAAPRTGVGGRCAVVHCTAAES